MIARVTRGAERNTSFNSVNPATGKLVRTFKEISDRDLELAVGTAHKAYETDWRLRTVAERAKIVMNAEYNVHVDHSFFSTVRKLV